jgi:hypothetical protein
MTKKLYEELANILQARRHCAKTLDTHREWFERWSDRIEHIDKHVLPSGSGFDSDSHVDIDACTDSRIVINTSFHHMDEHGGYCGWSEHVVTITPSFIGGFDIRVSGRNVRDIKDYIAEVFEQTLSAPYEYPTELVQS